MKEAYYFSHDTNARNDPKLIKVLMRFGQAGKGVYWDLIEMLYEQGGYLMLSECDSYAFALRSDCDLLKAVINDFELFENDDEKFWSNSLLKRLNLRKAKSEKAAESALKRWKGNSESERNANAMPTQCEGNAIKERKGKERKEDILLEKESKGEFPNFELIVKRYPGTKRGAKTEWDDFSKKFKAELTTDFLRAIWIGVETKSKTNTDIKKAGGFVPEWPHLKTYLNQRRWEEETEVPAPTPSEPKPYYTQSQEEQDNLFGGLSEFGKRQRELQLNPNTADPC